MSGYCAPCRKVRPRKAPSRFKALDLAARFGPACHLCGEDADPELHWNEDWFPTVDHLMPIALGGEDVLSNVAVAHRWCNTVRGVRPIEEFRSLVGAA
jgi:5-methylcytosine-specific restriction endonuclease McrA